MTDIYALSKGWMFTEGFRKELTNAVNSIVEPYQWDRGVVPTGADMRTLGMGSWSVTSNALFESLLNRPAAAEARGTGVVTVHRMSNNYRVLLWKKTASNGDSVDFASWQMNSGWVDWTRTGWNRGEIPTGANVHTLGPGSYRVSSFATFDSLLNAPAEARGIGTVVVRELTTTARTIKWTSAPSTGDPVVLYGYVLAAGFRGWFDHTPNKTAVAPTPALDTSNSITTTTTGNAGLRNAMLREAFYRRYRTSTGGKPVISLRFDDGHNAFKEKVLPLMREFGFPYSIAACSRRWDHVENNAVTPAEMNSWVVNDKAEIWNHTATHRDTGGAVDEIVNGLTELRTQLPNAEIWGFYAPGIENGFEGFLSTRRPEQLAATLGGQLALANHAVVSGYVVGASLRPIDPVPSTTAGFAHYSLDGRFAADAVAEVDRVIAAGGRENFMLHPSRLDLDTGVPLADFRTLLEKLKAEQDAGRLLVLSPYQMEAVTL